VAEGAVRTPGNAGRTDSDAASRPDGSLTIDELGRETGMTVRTIRSHQARGLLPPPDVRQRTGYYGPEHVARLRLIQELQAEGFNLKGITRLLEAAGGPAEQLLGLKRAATAPFESESPEVLTIDELAERFGDDVDPKTLARAEALDLLVPLGGGRYEAPSPSLLRAAEEVMEHGVALPAALSVVEQLRRHSEAVARSFVKLFIEGVWKPFDEAGHPEERWSEVVESIERLRPLASEALLAVFQQTMTREVEAAFGNELTRRARRGR
jgi:DNA-binding transcriptional MerR regulator